MTEFIVTIVDPAHLAGITAARLDYNSTLPVEVDEHGESSTPGLIETDAEYVQFVMAHAAESYAEHYPA